ncbi:hypothetical protein F4813DRAFT_398108 [Daldinia decipiens]|uniref:uncharacterized protein n=1 Tax=Daldinia decipiens TaxID=326647 RepID=UPI0020C31CFC|nr:uncharacterized protein F4813DRAFT_398108 [Daldinia decipiens]KAI1655483.1 hypothetical protein F4813DRAFT_398108 [Daldinia decipiens]
MAVGLALLLIVDGVPEHILRRIIRASMGIVAVWWTATAAIYTFQCIPVQAAWGVSQGTCLSSTVLGNVGVTLSAINVLVSWFYGLLPIWLLFTIQMPPVTKVSVMILLGLGALSSVATIFRFKFVLEVARAPGLAGLSNPGVVDKVLEGTMYSIIEVGIGIFAAAFTVMGSQINKCLPGVRSRNSSGPMRLGPIHRNSAFRGPTYEYLSYPMANSQEIIAPTRPDNVVTRRADVDVY